MLVQAGKSLVYYFHGSSAAREAYAKTMRAIARLYQDYLALVTVDSGEYPDMLAGLGLQSDNSLAVRNLHTGQTFPYEGQISPADVEAFIMAISEGKVPAWDAKREEIPVRDEL